jgi:hypothetical protein
MKKKILLVMLVFVALFAFTACGKKSKKNNDRSQQEVADAFFIKDGSKYALFSKDGKKLTNFDFTYAGNIINGTAVVEKDDEKGIIKSNGKMAVNFGKYKYISSSHGLYTARDEKYHEYLLDSNGKVIADLEDSKIMSFITDDNYTILFDKKNEKYKVLDVNGKAVITFDATDDEDEEPTVNSEDGYLSVHYDNKNYIIDLLSGKKLLEFNAKEHYCVNIVSKDGKKMTLNSCVKSYESQDKVKYKFIADGKLYDLSDKCDKITFYSDKDFVCIKDYKEYLIDSSYNVGIQIDGAAYKDNDHYAKAHGGAFDGIDFYNKDKVVKTVECRKISDDGYVASGIYLLTTYYSRTCGTDSGSYDFYNEKGEKVFDKTFARAKNFDKNSIAIVSEDKENYYLIDTKGTKLSKDYDEIITRNNYYETRKNNLEGAIGTDGKLIVDAKYTDIWESQYNGNNYLVFNENNKKYILYSLDKKKEVTTFDAKPSFNSDYIYVNKDGKTEYYTYEGKKFYTTK